MKTYILFVFGMFDDHEDVEFFCTDVLGDTPVIKTVRFVIENSQNVIVIFDSDVDIKRLSQELFSVLTTDNIKFYFIFDRDSLVSAHLPKEVKDFIYRPVGDNSIMKLEYQKNNDDIIMDLDDLLDKIEQMGIDSLTPEEKNFLDNFEN
jgi:hypothetical protein